MHPSTLQQIIGNLIISDYGFLSKLGPPSKKIRQFTYENIVKQ